MKNTPFFIKFLGGSVLFVFAGIWVFSTYINLFLLDSIANTLSQITKTKVDVNSIDVGFREGLVLKINDIKIHSNYKNRKLFSAKEVSAVITYSSLFSENIKIKKSYVRQPNIYLQNLLHEYEKLFPGFYLRKMAKSHQNAVHPKEIMLQKSKNFHDLKKNLFSFPQTKIKKRGSFFVFTFSRE